MKEPLLSLCDWEEISAALWTKHTEVQRGVYGRDEETGDTKKWVEHLGEIMDKIGPDGHGAAAHYGTCDCQHGHVTGGALIAKLIKGQSRG